MQRDRDLFILLQQEKCAPILRFYRWEDRCLSYGRVQKIAPQVAHQARLEGWNIVERPTGGGLVFHENDLCFTILWTKNTPALPWKVVDSYAKIHSWVRESLEETGIAATKISKISAPQMQSQTQSQSQSQSQTQTQMQSQTYSQTHSNPEAAWCFKTPVCQDILLDDKKIVGGAQWREGKVALHQGSIQYPVPKAQIEIFKRQFQKHFNARMGDG